MQTTINVSGGLVCCLAMIVVFASRAQSDDKTEQFLKQQEVAIAGKTLFVHYSKPVDPERALELLKIMLESGAKAPIDLAKLIEYSNVNQEKCQDPRQVVGMKDDLKVIKENHPNLLPYIEKHTQAQFQLCGFHDKYKEEISAFKEKRPKVASKMANFKDRVAKFGKISKNNKGDKPVPSHHLNGAVTDMYEDYKRENKPSKKESNPSEHDHKYRGDAAIQTYQDMAQVIDGSRMWGSEVSPSIYMANGLPGAKGDGQLSDALRHDNVYEQAQINNYGESMSDMFADAFYDKDNKMWNTWREWMQ